MSFLRKIGFFTAFILPLLVVVGFYAGDWWNYLTILFVFILVPIIDYLVGLDTHNVPEDKVKIVSEERYYRFVTYVWAYVQLIFIVWAAIAAASGSLTSISEWIGFVVSVGLVTGGVGITVAHELGHKKSSLERFYSKALLMTVCYMHFYIEHNRGHHVHVATPEDPATARKNESFYIFWLRSVIIGFIHGWNLEAESLKRKGLPILSLYNQMIGFIVLPIVFCCFLVAVNYLLTWDIAWSIPVFFFLQSVIAFTLLELVNYIEHYGILRKEISPGRYEQVNPLHSWNASHLISNFFLFQLQRHSDHHAYAHKRYQVLNHYDESPQLPFGYPTMIILALLPPVWFSFMNTRLEKWEVQRSLVSQPLG
jgi:alkane 1-monooxygenase